METPLVTLSQTIVMTLSQTVDIDIHSISLFKIRRDDLYCVQIYYTIRPDLELRCHNVWRRLPNSTHGWGSDHWYARKGICKDCLRADKEDRYKRIFITWLEVLLVFGTSKEELIEIFRQDVIYGRQV